MTLERFVQITSELEARVRSQLKSTGADMTQSQVLFRLDMRYEGQGYEVEVVVPQSPNAQAMGQLPELFAKAYETIFGMSFNDRAVEIVAWKCEVQGPIPGLDAVYRLRTMTNSKQALRGHRPVYLPEDGGHIECPVYDRYALAAGATVNGPALIEEVESTCVLAPGDVANIDEQLNLVIDIGGI
jgi:N-methylhydantoinase A